MTDFEKNRVEELRNWSFSFFQNFRLKFITWWTPLREPADEEKAVKNEFVASEVDMILKTEKVLKERKAVEFIDPATLDPKTGAAGARQRRRDQTQMRQCVVATFMQDLP